MPEQDNGKERLTGNTVEQQDAEQIASVRSNIAQYTQEQYGLPSETVIGDAEIIPPRSYIEGKTNPESKIVHLDPYRLPPEYSAVASRYRLIRTRALKARQKQAA